MDDDENSTQEASQENVTSESQSQAIILTNLESLIKGHITSIDKISNETKKELETLENVLLNDPTYRQHEDAAKEANKTKAVTKSQIMKQPSVVQLTAKIKEFRAQAKEMKDELSEYLVEYQRLANTDTIEDEQGRLHTIINSAKLARRSK